MPDVLQMSPLTIVLMMLSVFLAFFVATFIIIMLIRGLGQRKRGNSPRLTLNAIVTGKRQARSEMSETHYVTFEADNGQREELVVDGATYGLLAPGDAGQLTVQGAKYLGFVRR